MLLYLETIKQTYSHSRFSISRILKLRCGIAQTKGRKTCPLLTQLWLELTQFALSSVIQPLTTPFPKKNHGKRVNRFVRKINENPKWRSFYYQPITSQSWAQSRCSGARSIQPKFPEISVQNSMDRFGPTGKVSEKQVHLLRWSSFPGRTGLNVG